MAPNVLIKCQLCGKDIPVGTPRFSIGDDDICVDCASSATLEEIFGEEKISDVSFFDGEVWNNPFVGPENEGDTGENYAAEILATPLADS